MLPLISIAVMLLLQPEADVTTVADFNCTSKKKKMQSGSVTRTEI